MTGADAVRLLQVDPDLGRLAPSTRREEAVAAVVAGTLVLRMGEWTTATAFGDDGYMGLLLLDGIIAREVVVADNVSTELLGPGDLTRPWHTPSADDGLLPSDVRWTALAETRLAILDRRF